MQITHKLSLQGYTFITRTRDKTARNAPKSKQSSKRTKKSLSNLILILDFIKKTELVLFILNYILNYML